MTKKSIIYFGILIALLNVFDGFATSYGWMNDFIEESNPLMEMVLLESPVLFLLLKITLSLLVITISFMVYKRSQATFQRLYVVSLLGVCYGGIFSLHILWLTFI